jgi:hypothetical protein
MKNKRRFVIKHFSLKKLLIAEGQVRYNQREVRQRETEGPGLVLSAAWSAHCIFAGGGGFVYVTVDVSFQDI